MKIIENNIVLTKRDLLTRCNQLERALSTQAQRAHDVERQNGALIAEIVRLRAMVPVAA